MKIFKTIILIIVCIGTFIYLGDAVYKFQNPCLQTTYYSLGRFDNSFGIDQKYFLDAVKESADFWNKELGHDVFVYKDNGPFKVSLIFDERQKTIIQKNRTESGLEQAEKIFTDLDRKFEELKSEYDRRVSAYDSKSKDLDMKIKSIDNRIKLWNQNPGTSQEEYKSLQKSHDAVNKEIEVFNQENASIQKMYLELDKILKDRNRAGEIYNSVAKKYNEKYGHGLEFNQAEYVNEGRGDIGRIDIYQFTDRNDLVRVLAHEFGHALGMDHVENPSSLLYYVANLGNKEKPYLTPEDRVELSRVCKI